MKSPVATVPTLFDLIAKGQLDGYAFHPGEIVLYPGGVSETEILLEAALFETGRPVLVVPKPARGPFGANTVVAWNESAQLESRQVVIPEVGGEVELNFLTSGPTGGR